MFPCAAPAKCKVYYGHRTRCGMEGEKNRVVKIPSDITAEDEMSCFIKTPTFYMSNLLKAGSVLFTHSIHFALTKDNQNETRGILVWKSLLLCHLVSGSIVTDVKR